MMEQNNQKAKKAPLIYAIVGVMTLIVAVAGSTYAFYAASVSDNTNVTGTAGGGAAPTMSITKVSTEATGNLIPIDMNITTLNAAASATKQCVDNNEYTACQVYSVTITNRSTVPQAYDIKLTSLNGDNTPNIEAVTMGTSSNSVTSANSIKSNGTICTTNSVNENGVTTACYFMVFVKNLDTAQTDSGVFNGTVTATSTTGGGQIKADFS